MRAEAVLLAGVSAATGADFFARGIGGSGVAGARGEEGSGASVDVDVGSLQA